MPKFKYTIEQLNDDLDSHALEQIKNIFDQQIIPIIIGGNLPDIQLNHLKTMPLESSPKVLFTLDLSCTELSAEELKIIEKEIEKQTTGAH